MQVLAGYWLYRYLVAFLLKNKPKPRGNYFIRNFYYLDLGGKIAIYCFICCSQDVKKNMQKGSFIFFRVSLGLYLWPSVMKSHNFYSLIFMSLM